MPLVIDRLTAEQRRLVRSFMARSATIAPASRHQVAESIAGAIRSAVIGESEFPDDLELVEAVGAALESATVLPAADSPSAGTAFDAPRDENVAGRRYLLARIDGFVARGTIDASAGERMRAIIVHELAEIDAERSRTYEPAPTPAVAPPVDLPPPAPAGPSTIDLIADATTTFATEQTPSLLLYIGAFLIVVAAFIFVSVQGERVSDLVKLALMLVGTGGFLAAGVVCHRYPRVLPAGRTFLVIGALIAPLDIVAYYVLVSRVSPLDAPTLWTIGSLVCGGLYAALRLAGYGVGYSYLFYAAMLSAIFGVEALVKLPLAWAPVPIAALAVVVEWLRPRTRAEVATLIEPMPEVTIAIAALAGAALLIPLGASRPVDRAGFPADAALLTVYYVMRARASRTEALAAALGPAGTILGLAYSLGVSEAALGVVAVLVGTAYLSHELSDGIRTELAARAPWASQFATPIGLALLGAGLLPLATFTAEPLMGAVAFGVVGGVLFILSLGWDDRPGGPGQITGEYLLGAGLLALVVGYRFALAAAELLPIAQNAPADLARSYAPVTLAAWVAAAALRRRPEHGLVAAAVAAALTLAVSIGSYADAVVHTVVNAVYAGAAAGLAIRLVDRRVLWIAAAAAVLGATGAYRWSGASVEWLPLIVLAPALIAFIGSYAVRPLRGDLLLIATTVSLVGAGLGLALGPTTRQLPDSLVWRTAMIAIAAGGGFGAIVAWRRRSLDLGIAAALSLPVLIDMAVLTAHPLQPEPLTAPFAAYGFVATWVARRSKLEELRLAAPLFEYVAAGLTIAPTVARANDFTTLIASLVIAFALLGAAARWQLLATTQVALVALLWIAISRVFVDPRIDEIKIAAGALLLAACVLTVRPPQRIRLPAVAFAELVAAALIVVPTAIVTFLEPVASHFDVPVPLLLVIELAALYTVAVVYQRVILLRALIAVSTVAALEYVGLASFGEWYAALLGSAMINAALAIARRWPNGRSLREHAVLGAVGVGVLFLPSLGDVLAKPTFELTAEVLAAGIGVVVAAALLGEVWICGAALGVIAIASTVVMRLPQTLQLPGVGAGAALIAIAVAFPRFQRRGLPLVFSSLFDLLGLWLFLVPTFLLTYTKDATLQHAILMAQILVLIVSGLSLRRRWQILAAIGMLSIETVRAIFEIVNRIPSFATFAIAGALLLAIGFLLLLKRELFERWRARIVRWWVAWLAASS